MRRREPAKPGEQYLIFQSNLDCLAFPGSQKITLLLFCLFAAFPAFPRLRRRLRERRVTRLNLGGKRLRWRLVSRLGAASTCFPAFTPFRIWDHSGNTEKMRAFAFLLCVLLAFLARGCTSGQTIITPPSLGSVAVFRAFFL